jgi:hypothetical protein
LNVCVVEHLVWKKWDVHIRRLRYYSDCNLEIFEEITNQILFH